MEHTKKHEKRPILILGSYGRGNIGDDVFIHTALKLFPDRKIYINSSDAKLLPDSVAKQITSISTNKKTDIIKKIKVFITVKHIVYWGGDVWVMLYGNRYPRRILYGMVIVNLISRIFGKRVHYVGCGIGNLEGYSRALAKMSTILADDVVYREKRSMEVMTPKRGRILPDLAVNLDYPESFPKDPLKGKRIIGISLLYYLPNPDIDFPNLIDAIKKFILTLDPEKYEVRLLPMLRTHQVEHDDVWASRQLLEALREPRVRVLIYEAKSVSDFISQLQKCYIAIGVRLHANILATLGGTPAIGISYRPKVNSFFVSNNMPDLVLELSELDRLQEIFDNAITNYDSLLERVEASRQLNFAAKTEYEELVKKYA